MAWTTANLPRSMSSSDLQPAELLGDGGQGTVHAVLGSPELAIKTYLHTNVQERSLALLVNLSHSMPTEARQLVNDSTTWPLATIQDKGRTVGVVMRRLPQRFTERFPAGVRPRDVSYAVYPSKPMWAHITPALPSQRLELARALAEIFSVIHRVGAIYGDLSYYNVAWCLEPRASIFLMDCDSIRVSGSNAAHRHAVTIDWDDPHHSGADTLDSDRYKLALFIGRLLTQDHSIRPGAGLAIAASPWGADVADRVSRLFTRAGGPRGTRPTALEWLRALSR